MGIEQIRTDPSIGESGLEDKVGMTIDFFTPWQFSVQVTSLAMQDQFFPKYQAPSKKTLDYIEGKSRKDGPWPQLYPVDASDKSTFRFWRSLGSKNWWSYVGSHPSSDISCGGFHCGAGPMPTAGGRTVGRAHEGLRAGDVLCKSR